MPKTLEANFIRPLEEKIIKSQAMNQMNQFLILLSLLPVFAMSAFSQEEVDNRRSKAEQEMQGRKRERQDYQQGRYRVADPDNFKVEGGQVFSGPQSGEKLPRFRATSLFGENKGETFNPVSLADGRPQIIFFQTDSGVALRGLFGVGNVLGKINANSDRDIHLACIFLNDDPTSLLERLGGKAERSEGILTQLKKRGVDLLAISPEGRNGPGALGLNRNVAQTVLLAKNGHVTRNYVFNQGMLYPDPHFLGGLAELIGEDRETVATWLRVESQKEERSAMRGREDSQGPAKRALRRKLREFVQDGKISGEEARETYQAAFPEP